MTTYNKLVRDRIPEVIAADGRVAKTHVADDAEFLERLKEKLREETEELITDMDRGEVADVLEVLDALCAFNGWSAEDVQAIKAKKNAERGGFAGRIVLEED